MCTTNHIVKVLQALKTLEMLVYKKGKIKSTEIWEAPVADSSLHERVKNRLVDVERQIILCVEQAKKHNLWVQAEGLTTSVS